MYTVSFNVMYKDDDRKIVLTETPYLYINESLRNILLEIRRLVKEDIIKLSEQMQIPATNLAFGMTTFSSNENRMHFREVNIYNIRELKEALLGI